MTKNLHSLLIEVDLDISGISNPLIKDICCDSRLIKEGDLFFGLTGSNFDGASFWNEALAKGAAAVVLSSSIPLNIPESYKGLIVFVPDPVAYWMGEFSAAFWDRPSLKIDLIGVTGTNGKTTTTHLIEHLSEASGTPASLFGTLFNRWQGHSEVAIQTTRFSHILHSQLFKAVSSGSRLGAMEVSSHALDQYRVSGLRFTGAIFTNLTQDHLDYHISMESYFEAKARLFEPPLLSANGPNAIVNIDNKWGRLLASRLKDLCWRSSLDDETIKSLAPELFMTNLQINQDGVKGVVHTPFGEGPFRTSLIGEFNLMNLLQALGSLLQHGFQLEHLLEAVADFPGVPGRMELIRLAKVRDQCESLKVIVDYAHTPDGLKNALLASKSFTLGKLICVFGCGGDRDQGKRAQMGAIASKLADKVIITSDNPRTEDPQKILNDIESGIATSCEVIIQPDRYMAIEIAITSASLTDLVIIAGKGHEDYQIIGEERRHFDDREVAKEILERRFS